VVAAEEGQSLCPLPRLPAQAFPFPKPKKTEQLCFVTVHRNIHTDWKLNLAFPVEQIYIVDPTLAPPRNSNPE